MGIPAAWFEKIEAQIRNRTARESIIQEAAADRFRGAILSDGEVSRVVTEIALCSSLVPTANKMRVAELAINELLRGDVGEEDHTSGDEQKEVDQDWLNHFASYAERVSSEGVRNLWARVLAGEIRRNGSFSLSSLRLLSELDQKMATTFQTEVKYRRENSVILKPKIKEMKGARLEALSFLEEVGLLQSIDAIGGVVNNIHRGRDGKGVVREQNLVLVVEIQRDLKLEIIPLTRAGREIASILEPTNSLEVLEKVGNAIEDKVTSMEIRRIKSRTKDIYNTVLIKTLKAKQG